MSFPQLIASISNKKTLDVIDTEIFDAFYLGQPYCLLYDGNFLTESKALSGAISSLKSRNKCVFLTTPAIPTTRDMSRVTQAIEAAVDAGIDGVEVSDVGLFRLARDRWPDLKLHVGNLLNVYNERSAALWRELGASRIVPAHELTAEELAVITAVEGLEFERPVYGQLTLGMAYSCMLRRDLPDERLGPCTQQCAEPHYLEMDGWRMRCVGTSLLMGEAYSLLEHLEGLLELRVDGLRLETYFDSPGRINAIGLIFKEAIAAVKACGGVGEHMVAAISELSAKGLCNGWHFGRSGRDYVGADDMCGPASSEPDKEKVGKS